MTGNNNNPQNTSRKAPLHATLRVVIAVFLQAVMFRVVSGVEAKDYDFQTGLNSFLSALLPTVSILLLIPILFRGTLGEKIIVAVLLLPAAWFGFMGWAAIISRLFG